MPIAEVPSGPLYYEAHGQGPWLILAHGAGGNHLSWWQQMPELREHFRCLIFDQGGWGLSRRPALPNPARLATDLAALLDHVGAERAALVGQSMGGWSVLGCALINPERITQLVLASTLAGLTDEAMINKLMTLHDPARPFNERLALAKGFPQKDPARTFLFEEIAALNQAPGAEFLAALIGLRYTGEVAKITMPVLFLAGGRDQLFPIDLIRQAREKVAHAQLAVVEEAGHSVYFESPGKFNRELLSFLKP